MHSEPAIENRAAAPAVRGRRRKRGNGSAEGPVFVDNSGRRSKLLRRLGLLVGVACLGYAVVLGMAFMGIGTSLTPSELLPFGGGGPAGAPNSGPGGAQPQGGVGTPPAKPTGTPPTGTVTGEPPSAAPTVSASASAAAAN
ncbi:hypothetical protein [Streptomyces caeruleatus]|uniref:Uncharacterized protein n=1 Tax=Streptomyces caeruleatus TaxID=661399 RepID=A0A124I6M8_9ACTN|nr:hypothetical protein [Streptomyces caeruleatus]KUN93601.1 hypothetical protein AQJ67_38350 [Streptomyces caeruleatus]